MPSALSWMTFTAGSPLSQECKRTTTAAIPGKRKSKNCLHCIEQQYERWLRKDPRRATNEWSFANESSICDWQENPEHLRLAGESDDIDGSGGERPRQQDRT